MKRLFLELGGKSADIVLDDADLEAKMGMACMVAVHGGQGCVMPTRMLVAAVDVRPGDRDRNARLRELPVRRPQRHGQPAWARS